jgi:hypothetical protein
MASLFSTSEETQYKINNLNRDEQQAMMLHLSRDSRILQDQIRFLNGDTKLVYRPNKTPINKSIAASDANISADLVAKTIYDLKKIDSLTNTLAKTTIGATKFLDKQIDNLGSTIINTLEEITSAAEDGITEMEYKLQEWSESAVEAERKFLNKTIYPCTSWAGDALKGISSELLDDVRIFNRHVSKSRLVNTPGDIFNSIRHIAFAIRGEIEKLIDFTHQMFAGLAAAMLKLKRLIKRAIKAITVFCLTLIEGLIPTDLLKSIGEAVNNIIKAAGESFYSLTVGLGLSTAEDAFQGLQDEVTKMAEHPLVYVFDQVGVEPFLNVPLLDQIKKLEKAERDIVNNKIFTEFLKFSDKFTLENLIKMLPKGAQETYKILNELSSNAHGFIGNGIRSYVRRKVLKNKRNAFIGKLNSFGVNFTLSVPYHYGTVTAYRSAPLITFKPLLTDNSGTLTVDKYGNKVVSHYTSFTSTRLY